jgi:hypothetical protein
MTDPTPTPPPAEARAVLNTPTLILGPSGSGKSSLLATAAEYVWETYRKVTHYALIDGGGFPMQMQALINVGIVRFWRARTRTGQGLAQETCQRISQGWWPAEIDPRTGQTKPDVKLVAPVQTRYTMRCGKGHVVKVVPFRSLLTAQLCPTCKDMVNDSNKIVETETHQTPGFEQVGALMIDGLTSACAWLMDDLTERAGRNELGGEKGAMGTIISGDIHIGSSNRAMYGSVQTRANALVNHSGGIPNLVIPPIWTALTTEGSDEGGLTIVGPQLAGQAKTAEAPQWFGDCMETRVVEREGKRFRQLMLQQYQDEGDKASRRHLCRVRSYPGQLPPFFEDEEGQLPPFQTFSLKHFYLMRDAALTTTLGDYAQRYPDAPGVPTAGLSTVGGGVEAPAASATPVMAGPTKAPAPRPVPAAARPAARPTPAAPAGTNAGNAGQPAQPAPGGGVTAPAATSPSAPAQPAAATPAPAARPTPTGSPRPAAPRPAVAAPARPAPPAPVSATPAAAAAPAPSAAATGPVAAPPAPPAAPARGPAVPPGRRPTPAPAAAPRPTGTPPGGTS